MTPLAATVQAPAKVNLFLRVLAREADGFHGLETLFCLLSLADTLRVERREGREVTIEVAGADVGPAADNLAVRAAELVLDATGRRFGANGVVPRHELLQFAARLGSDVPFFASGAPLALGWGHGERLLRLPPLPRAPALLPPLSISGSRRCQSAKLRRAPRSAGSGGDR